MRPYHSPSSIALGARCKRAWAYRYIAGIRDPELTWAQIEAGVECTSRQRSLALGKAMHAVLEDYYVGNDVDWGSFPARVAQSGTHLLPHPELVRSIAVEEPIGDHALPPSDRPDAPPTALRVHGVLWAGFRDLLAEPHSSELARLGLSLAPGGWVLLDYKSSANVERYALTPDELRRDVQCNLYGLDVMQRITHTRELAARWVYFETKAVRRAKPCDTLIRRDDALAVLEAPATLARELDKIERVEDAEPNVFACGDYGGCPFHVTAGGPCNARRSIGALIQLRKKKGNSMAISELAKQKFAGFRSSTPSASGEESAETTAPAEPVKRQRKPRVPRTTAPASTPAPLVDSAPAPLPEDAAGQVLAMHGELAEAHAALVEAERAATDACVARDDAAARVNEIMSRIREACA